MASQPVQAETIPETPVFSLRAILVPLITIIIGAFMAVLDTTATNVAVPTLVKDFHAPLSTLQWVITGYTLAQAAVIPLAGWLSDRYGAKQLFLTSIVLFTLGSVLCATAQNTGMLIAFRVLQGLGGGFIFPVALAYIYRLAPPERVGMVTGLMGIPILLGPAIGPVLAGWLVQDASWRWIFLINLPVGVVGVLLGLRGLPAVARGAVESLDYAGIALGPLAFASLVYGISEGSTSWTSSNTIGGIVVGAIALVAFIVVELRAASPLLQLRVFRSLDFDLAILGLWAGQFALFGALFLVPLFLQEVRGYGALDTGFSLIPQALATMIFLPIGGALFDRIGARPLVVVGSSIMVAAGLLLANVGITTRGWDLVLPLALYGSGMGLMIMSLNTQVLNAAPRALVARVSALSTALLQVISSIAVAGLASVLSSRTATHITEARAALAASPPRGSQAGVSQAVQEALSRAAATAFDDTFHVVAAVTVVAALLGLLLRRATVESPAVEGVEGAASQPLVAAPHMM
jgi:EmrB/QacA subfamily drug resistance transporter